MGLPILATLLQMGLPYVAEAVTGMAKDEAESFIKDKTGVILDLGGEKTPSKNEIKKLEHWNNHDLKSQMEANRHEEEVFKIEAEDLKDAREMGEAYVKSEDKFLSRFIPVLTIILSLIGFTYLIAVTFVEIPEANMQTANMITGAVLSVLLTKIISYWYGTSHSSSKKDAVIANSVPPQTNNSLNLF